MDKQPAPVRGERRRARYLLTGTALSGICLLGAWAGTQGIAIYSGDGNADGVLDAADVRATGDQLASEVELDEWAALLFDANQDGAVDGADVVYLVEVLLGLKPPLLLVTHIQSPTVSFGRMVESLPRHLSGAAVSFQVSESASPAHLAGPPVSFGREIGTLPAYLSGPSVSFGREIDTLPAHLSGPSVSFDRELGE